MATNLLMFNSSYDIRRYALDAVT